MSLRYFQVLTFFAIIDSKGERLDFLFYYFLQQFYLTRCVLCRWGFFFFFLSIILRRVEGNEIAHKLSNYEIKNCFCIPQKKGLARWAFCDQFNESVIRHWTFPNSHRVVNGLIFSQFYSYKGKGDLNFRLFRSKHQEMLTR